MDKKFVIIIQCDIAKNRCSGFACTDSFYKKEGKFEGYDEDTKYISFTCGGCCGKATSAKLGHFLRKSAKKNRVNQEEFIVHLSSCMVTDNYHYDRCPHVGYIKDIIRKRGIEDIVEGTYISKAAEDHRKKGEYKTY